MQGLILLGHLLKRQPAQKRVQSRTEGVVGIVADMITSPVFDDSALTPMLHFSMMLLRHPPKGSSALSDHQHVALLARFFGLGYGYRAAVKDAGGAWRGPVAARIQAVHAATAPDGGTAHDAAGVCLDLANVYCESESEAVVLAVVRHMRGVVAVQDTGEAAIAAHGGGTGYPYGAVSCSAAACKGLELRAVAIPFMRCARCALARYCYPYPYPPVLSFFNTQQMQMGP